MRRRFSIRLAPFEREALVQIYLHHQLATDRYKDRPGELADVTHTFNNLTGRTDLPAEVLHYMETKRKNGDWVTLDGQHRRLPQLGSDFLKPDEWQVLDKVYVDIGVGSDQFAYDSELQAVLEQAFHRQGGRRVGGRLLATALRERRKDGLLPKLPPKPKAGGFNDFDELAT